MPGQAAHHGRTGPATPRGRSREGDTHAVRSDVGDVLADPSASRSVLRPDSHTPPRPPSFTADAGEQAQPVPDPPMQNPRSQSFRSPERLFLPTPAGASWDGNIPTAT